MIRKKANHLNLALINVRSLRAGHEELSAAIDRYKPDLIALNETWLKKDEEKIVPAIAGYTLKSNPRLNGKKGGGVGFYIRKGVRARVKEHPPSQLEQMWLELQVSGVGRFAVGTAYRPESVTVQNAIGAIGESLDTFGSCRGIFLLSDFNVNVTATDKPNAKMLQTFMMQRNLVQLVSEPTRITDDSATTLDLLITDCPSLVKSIHLHHNTGISDHAMVIAELTMKKQKPIPFYVYNRQISKIDQIAFEADLNTICWEEIRTLRDVNEMVLSFNHSIITLFDKHSPVRQIRVNQQSYPWITENIKILMDLRDAALNKARRTKKESHKDYYRVLRNYTNGALDREKKAYFTFYVNKNQNKPKRMWNHIKYSTIMGHPERPQIPEQLCDPDAINDFFLQLPGNPETDRDSQRFFENSRISHDYEFSIKKCTETEVAKIISSISTNACGNDGISIEMIRLTLKATLPIITHMINWSIETGIFPENWKIAKVRPIPKSSKAEEYKDLRPISILPVLSKVIERIVCDQLTEYLEEHNLLPTTQSGFRGRHGTATALTKVTDDIIAASDKGMGTILVLLDFSRAFDCLNPELLLAKMTYYGAAESSRKWFQSFLTNRKQYIEVDTGAVILKSDTRELDRGTPQGSILSPLLFILYTADLVTYIKHCKTHLYADDTQLYYAFAPQDLNQTLDKINEDLEAIACWSVRNNLVLNPSKSQFVIMGSKWQRKKICEQDPVVLIGTEPVARVEQVKNLGLVMEGEMRYTEHINIKIRNAFFRLKSLYSIRKYLSIRVREILVEALVLSQLNYGDTIYGPRLLSKTKTSIQRVQNACVRFCYEIPRRAHITPYLNNKGILNMANRRHLHLAFVVRKVIEFERPKYLFDELKWVKDARTRPLRSHRETELRAPQYKTALFRGGFKFAATKIWNDLPPPIREPMPLLTFKRRVKAYLLERQRHGGSPS